MSLEIELLPYADVFAGILLWDASHTPVVSRAWKDWTASVPESDAVAAEPLLSLRGLAPEVDTFARIPAAALVQVHTDPPQPTPAMTRLRCSARCRNVFAASSPV